MGESRDYDQMENDLETFKLYTSMVKEQLVEAYDLLRFVYDSVPPQHLPVSFLDRMDRLYGQLSVLGVEVDR